VSRIPYRLGGDQEGRHRSLVVADAFAQQQVSFPPGAVIDAISRIRVHQIGFPRHRGVHVAIEDQAVAASSTGQRPENVEAVAYEPDPARSEALLPHPVVQVLADLAFMAHGAVDVADLQRETH
jgi:hypothetical protein